MIVFDMPNRQLMTKMTGLTAALHNVTNTNDLFIPITSKKLRTYVGEKVHKALITYYNRYKRKLKMETITGGLLVHYGGENHEH